MGFVIGLEDVGRHIDRVKDGRRDRGERGERT
jgi:hypothetical protein